MSTFSSFFGTQNWLEIDPKKSQTRGLRALWKLQKRGFGDGLKYAFEVQSSDPKKVSMLV